MAQCQIIDIKVTPEPVSFFLSPPRVYHFLSILLYRFSTNKEKPMQGDSSLSLLTMQQSPQIAEFTPKEIQKLSSTASILVTYKFENELICVPLAPNWMVSANNFSLQAQAFTLTNVQEAVAYARHAFKKLASVLEKQIIFSLAKDRNFGLIRIIPSAWKRVSSELDFRTIHIRIIDL